MSDLNENWKPTFGTIYTWFAMDKNGRIAMMMNNSWGDLPSSILSIKDIGWCSKKYAGDKSQ